MSCSSSQTRTIDLTAPALLRATGLGRRFGYRHIFQHVDLSVHPGEALLLVGPNGTGKTTFLRVLGGLLVPSTGSVTATGSIDFVGHETMTYDALSARENLRFFATLIGGEAPDRVEALLERIQLDSVADQPIERFSRGMRQRLAVARALLRQPDVLLLDEPFSSLDEQGVSIVSDVVAEWRDAHRGVVVVSHDLARAVPVCSSMVTMVGGSLLPPEPLDGDAASAAASYARTIANA